MTVRSRHRPRPVHDVGADAVAPAPLPAHRLHGLQSAAGNRAVTAAVQRYHTITAKDVKPGQWDGLPADTWRVSDDGAMVVKDSNLKKLVGGAPLQSFYATSGVLAAAAGRLAAINSPFLLTPGGGTVQGPPDPKTKARPSLQEVDFTHADQQGPGAKGTFRNCDENTRNALGMGRPGGANPGRSVGVDAPGLAATPINLLDASGAFMASQIVSSIVEEVSKADAATSRKRGAFSKKSTVPLPTDGESIKSWALKHYAKLPEKVREDLAATFGINQHAVPQPGEAVGIVDPATNVGHFFPAVATSGHDWVSLENDTDQKGNQKENTNWYYRMYGPASGGPKGKTDQTVYGEAKAAGTYGKTPVVIKIVPLETLTSKADCARVAHEEFRKAVAMLLSSSHSFAYIGMASRDDVAPLLEDLKVYKDGAAPDDDLTAIAGQWKSTADAIKSASKPAQEKLAERGIRLLEQLIAVLAQIDQRRAALAV